MNMLQQDPQTVPGTNSKWIYLLDPAQHLCTCSNLGRSAGFVAHGLFLTSYSFVSEQFYFRLLYGYPPRCCRECNDLRQASPVSRPTKQILSCGLVARP